MQLNTWRNFTRYAWVSCGGKGCSIISSSDCAKRAWRPRQRRVRRICTCRGAAIDDHCSCIWRQTKTRLVHDACPSAIVSSKTTRKKVWKKNRNKTQHKTTTKQRRQTPAKQGHEGLSSTQAPPFSPCPPCKPQSEGSMSLTADLDSLFEVSTFVEK